MIAMAQARCSYTRLVQIELWNLLDLLDLLELLESEVLPPKEFYQSLGIPYRTVAIVSGELNNAAAKKWGYWGAGWTLSVPNRIHFDMVTWGHQIIFFLFASGSALMSRKRYDLEGWFPGDAEGKGKPSA